MLDISFSISFENNNDSKPVRRDKGKSLIQFPDEYIVLDTETTGFDYKYDSLIEVGAIKYRNGEEVDRFSELIKPSSWFELDESEIKATDDYCLHDGVPIAYVDSFITELTGITNKMLEDAREEKAVLIDFFRFLGDEIVIGHNVNFDVNFLYDAAMANFGYGFSNNFVDTLRIARRVLKDKLDRHRLQDVAAYYGIDCSHSHRAIADCDITHNCLRSMKKNIVAQYGTIETFISALAKKPQEVRAKNITAQTREFDEDHPLYGKVCVFTGAMERFTRKEAMQMIANLGGINGDNVTAKTNYLILGNLEYSKNIKGGKSNKLKKAERLRLKGLDIEILSENVFYDMLLTE